MEPDGNRLDGEIAPGDWLAVDGEALVFEEPFLVGNERRDLIDPAGHPDADVNLRGRGECADAQHGRGQQKACERSDHRFPPF